MRAAHRGVAGYTRGMQVYLDGQALAVERATLASGLRAASEAAQKRGRVVVEVYVDGNLVSDTILSDPPDEVLGAEMRMVSVEPRLLVRETLLDAAEALDKAGQEQTDAADEIQCGRVEGAMPLLQSAILKWQAVRDAVEKSASLLEIPLDSRIAGPGDRNLGQVVEGLATSLTEVRRTLESEDWSGLADLLAYDMAEQVKSWQGMLRSLADGLLSGRAV
jgi:hypothetical protein